MAFRVGDRVVSIGGTYEGQKGTVVFLRREEDYELYVRVQFDGRNLQTGKSAKNLRHEFPAHLRMDEGL